MGMAEHYEDAVLRSAVYPFGDVVYPTDGVAGRTVPDEEMGALTRCSLINRGHAKPEVILQHPFLLEEWRLVEQHLVGVHISRHQIGASHEFP